MVAFGTYFTTHSDDRKIRQVSCPVSAALFVFLNGVGKNKNQRAVINYGAPIGNCPKQNTKTYKRSRNNVSYFAYALDRERLKAAAPDFAENIKPTVDGLLWKIFLNQPEQRRSGGVYLFRDAGAAHSYLNSPYVQKLRRMPELSDFSIQIFETMSEASIAAGASMSAGV